MLQLAISDYSIERAEDVLRTLVDAYNDAWLEDKNKVAANTSKFINERLRVIETDWAMLIAASLLIRVAT